jgi:hypothetical protein
MPVLLADHMDMARPPHENPEYYASKQQQQAQFSVSLASAGSTSGSVAVSFPQQQQHYVRSSPYAMAMPIAIPAMTGFTFSSPGSTSHAVSQFIT